MNDAESRVTAAGVSVDMGGVRPRPSCWATAWRRAPRPRRSTGALSRTRRGAAARPAGGDPSRHPRIPPRRRRASSSAAGRRAPAGLQEWPSSGTRTIWPCWPQPARRVARRQIAVRAEVADLAAVEAAPAAGALAAPAAAARRRRSRRRPRRWGSCARGGRPRRRRGTSASRGGRRRRPCSRGSSARCGPPRRRCGTWRLLARRRLRAVAREVAHLVADAARPRLLPRLVHVVDDLHGPHPRRRAAFAAAKPPPVARTRSAPPPRGRRRRATALARRRRAQGARWRQNGSFVAAVSPWPRRSTRDSRGARRAFGDREQLPCSCLALDTGYRTHKVPTLPRKSLTKT